MCSKEVCRKFGLIEYNYLTIQYMIDQFYFTNCLKIFYLTLLKEVYSNHHTCTQKELSSTCFVKTKKTTKIRNCRGLNLNNSLIEKLSPLHWLRQSDISRIRYRRMPPCPPDLITLDQVAARISLLEQHRVTVRPGSCGPNLRNKWRVYQIQRLKVDKVNSKQLNTLWFLLRPMLRCEQIFGFQLVCRRQETTRHSMVPSRKVKFEQCVSFKLDTSIASTPSMSCETALLLPFFFEDNKPYITTCQHYACCFIVSVRLHYGILTRFILLVTRSMNSKQPALRPGIYLNFFLEM